MIELDNDKLSQKIISEYWDAFVSGTTWNFYSSSLRNQMNEVWATKKDWLKHAKECISGNTNLLQALEILLVEDEEEYIDLAQNFVSEWYKSGAYDSYYYYELMAKLPHDNPYRKKYFSPKNFGEFIKNDDWGDSDSARKAMINAGDQSFIDFLGRFINEKLSLQKLSDDEIEYDVLPLLIDLGVKSKGVIARENLDRIKNFCLDYLEKDEATLNRYLNGTLCEDERQIWIGDNIAYYAWVLGWDDVIQSLTTKDWYWLGLFSDWWDDIGNKNLLVWSLCRNDKALKDRAVFVMHHDEYNKLDGAIAWKRLKLLAV